MNLDRLVVRLAAVSALNNFLRPPYPTLAGDKIFDSRIEAVEDFKDKVMFPIAVVYTDYDKNHWAHQSLSNEDRLLTVTFEILIAQISEIPDDGGFLVEHPNTDSELETSLDIFEMQISEALRADNVAADCWRHLMYRYNEVTSRRGATVEGGQKLAARQVAIESCVPRGPANGALAEPVAAFLDELEKHDDFEGRVSAIRDMYTAAAGLTPAEQLMRVMSWSTDAARRVGYDRGPAVMLPQTVVYTDPQGRPLT